MTQNVNPEGASRGGPDIPECIAALARDLLPLQGVVGVVLGGLTGSRSREARLRFRPRPLLPRGSTFNWQGVAEVVRRHDDAHTPAAVTSPYEWGPWINGGAWLRVQNHQVDILYRELNRVEEVIRCCTRGKITSDYNPGHPSAFHDFMLMGEVHHNRLLLDPSGRLADLQAATVPYPDALGVEIVRRFLWEATFTLFLLRKNIDRPDPYYLRGLAFRFVSCLVQVLFGLNRRYFLNEKGSVAEAAAFETHPARFAERVAALAAGSIQSSEQSRAWIDGLQELLSETERLASANTNAT